MHGVYPNMTKDPKTLHNRGRPLCASAALCLSLIVTGCNTYILSPIHGPTPAPATVAVAPILPSPVSPAETPVPVPCSPTPPGLNSLLCGVADWFVSHNYSFITNRTGDEVGFSAKFASPHLEQATYNVCITADQANEILTLTAVLPGSLAAIPDHLVPTILTIFNYRQSWGHYGFDFGAQALCFKLSLFRSNGQCITQEMDRLLEEALTAMDSGIEALVPLKQDDIQDEDKSALQNTPDSAERVEPSPPSSKARSRLSLHKVKLWMQSD